jgi:hypothetical protein
LKEREKETKAKVIIDKNQDQMVIRQIEIDLETFIKTKYVVTQLDMDKMFQKCFILLENGRKYSAIQFLNKLSLYFPDQPLFSYGASFAFLNYTKEASDELKLSEFDIFKRGYRLAQAAYKLEPDNQLFLSNLTFYYEVAYIEYAGDVDWTGMLDILNYQESKNIKPEDTYKKGEFAMLRGMIYLVMEDKENAKKYIDECESIDKRTFAKAIKTLRKDLKKLG